MATNLNEDSSSKTKYEIQNESQLFLGNSKVEEYTEEKMINPINDMTSNLLKPLEKNKSHSVSTKLSFYWIEIIASLGLFLFIIMYEIFSIIFLFSLFGLFVKGIVILGQIIKLIFGTMGINGLY